MIQNPSAQRRNPFLVIMVLLANLYLIGFALDAGLSLVEETFRAITGEQTLLVARTMIALAVVLAAIVMLFTVIFVPHLPKRVFVPLIVFTMWAELGAPPLSLTLEGGVASFAIIIAQFLLAVAAFAVLKKRNGTWLLRTAHLPLKRHLVLRFVAAIVVTTVFIPLAISGLGVLGIATMFEQKSGHYVDFTASGLNTTERTFQKGNKTVHLIAMMHVGEADFYTTLFSGFPSDSLVLMEGARDEKGLLKNNLSYKRVAQALGLEAQTAFIPKNNSKL